MIDRRTCSINFDYRYKCFDECYQRLSKLKKKLDSCNLKCELEKTNYYGECWRLTCRDITSLEITEEIYKYCDEICLPASFRYIPSDNYTLLS